VSSRRVSHDTLSDRGRRLVEHPPFAEYIGAHFERHAHRFDPASNPDGYIALCIAENQQMWHELAARLAAVTDVPPRVLGYDAMIGSVELRSALAAFMGRAFVGREIAAEQLAVVAGAGAVLELLFHAICDPGDGVLVPTPSYAGFWADLETRDEQVIVPVPRSSADGFRLTADALERAFAGAGRPVKALLLTTPDNPLGRVYAPAELHEIIAWAESKTIHLVLDEVYALSVFGSHAFVSGASLRPTLGDRTHLVWAFSKDFGASGLRCGVLCSENPDVLRAVDGLAYWAACSGHTQHLLREIVSDTPWVDAFLAEMRRRLAQTYALVTTTLAEVGIPFVPASGGIFVMCDLRACLPEPTWDAEARLWRTILEEGNVNLTPGSACRCSEPGFFRLCYASETHEALAVGIRRIGRLANPAQ
jgi:aspartate/methionine/tyrosine aminotransferase